MGVTRAKTSTSFWTRFVGKLSWVVRETYFLTAVRHRSYPTQAQAPSRPLSPQHDVLACWRCAACATSSYASSSLTGRGQSTPALLLIMGGIPLPLR